MWIGSHMIIIRPISRKDQDVFVEFSFSSTLGIRNLPRNKDKLYQKIIKSEQSFAHRVKQPNKEEYLFVLEDLSTGRIGGTCGIFATLNTDNFCAYRTETLSSSSAHPSMIKDIKILKLVLTPKLASEICALYLQPTFRHSGQGRLLSLSRFLFVASHRERFRNKLIAEIRGYVDQRQTSPFWEAVGRHFCDLSFVELMAQIDQDAIPVKQILPRYPLYISLLPKEVQEVIGKAHDTSKAAIDMLLHEGFKFNGEIDALEAGPTLIAKTAHIRSIKHNRVIHIEITKDPLFEETEFILANTSIDFRACYGNILLKGNGSGVINQDIAEALQVKPGQPIRYVSLH